MKLWKSKKSSSSSTTTSCVPGKSTSSKNDDKITIDSSQSSTTISGDRAMSPAQSEDSGLAADRGTTYATITLPRENTSSMGIIFAERTDLSYPPIISSLNAIGPAADFLAPGDRIHQIDGISTIGLTNNHVLNILQHADGPALVEIEYSLPEYISQNSLCVTTKLAQITVERENGCLGLTLRGGGDFPLIVTNVRPHGPAFKTGRIKPGDRLLRVDNISLINKTLSEAQQILKCGHSSGFTNLTIEYDVSVMQSVEFSLGPLLIEIERPMSDKLGLILSHYSSVQHNDHSNKLDDIQPAGVYIANILPASIADRCGALSIGDQILTMDETIIENTAFSPEDVMAFLDATTNRGYTQIQIMPVHALARRGINYGNFNTLESRKNTRQRKFSRKSSLPLESNGTIHSTIGLCRSEIIQVVLDCTHGSGLVLTPSTTIPTHSSCAKSYTITQILRDTSGDRSGSLQKGDRILSINKLYNLDIQTIRQILGDIGPRQQQQQQQTISTSSSSLSGPQVASTSTHWVELEVEFDMADSVIPASGVFNVKLAKTNRNGLGITVNGTTNGTYIITEVKMGSPAHRTGSLRAGDILLAVDALTLQHFNVDSLLKDNKNEYTTLTIKRNSLPDFLFDAQQRCNHIYGGGGGGAGGSGGVGGGITNCANSNNSINNINNNNNTNNSNNNQNNGSSDGNDENLYGYNIGTTVNHYINSDPLTTFQADQQQISDYYQLDDGSRQSTPIVQIRRPFLNKQNSNNNNNNVNSADSTGWLNNTNNNNNNNNDINTNSLITEINNDQYNDDIAQYEIDYHQKYMSFDSCNVPPPMENHIYSSSTGSLGKSLNTNNNNNNNNGGIQQMIINVRLEGNGGPLGITLSGSEDLQKPIIISGLIEGGIAYNTNKLNVGDCLLAINNENVQGVPLSHATKLLQNFGNLVDLKIQRNVKIDSEINHTNNNAKKNGTFIERVTVHCNSQPPQPQAVYAKIQRRPKSPMSFSDAISNSSKDERFRSFHVTLHKDKVYDDYGFSVSDGLYERGVYINRIRSGGPADIVGLLKPYDRIMQVNGTKTQDFDCCLTVPLIASAGDKIDLVLQRPINE